jgi:protein translocase SecG subunit
MLENIWFAIILILVTIILSTDPKTSIVGAQKNQIDMLFSSASDSQTFFRRMTWALVATFYTTTLLISYYG